LEYYQSIGIRENTRRRRIVPPYALGFVARQFNWDRRIFITDTGLLGMAPDYAQEGDVVYVPLGCFEPILFRKVDNHYISIGEFYVDESMYGKALMSWIEGRETLWRMDYIEGLQFTNLCRMKVIGKLFSYLRLKDCEISVRIMEGL